MNRLATIVFVEPSNRVVRKADIKLGTVQFALQDIDEGHVDSPPSLKLRRDIRLRQPPLNTATWRELRLKNPAEAVAGGGWRRRMERAKGIEPSYEAWEASVLPLNYARSSHRLAQP